MKRGLCYNSADDEDENNAFVHLAQKRQYETEAKRDDRRKISRCSSSNTSDQHELEQPQHATPSSFSGYLSDASRSSILTHDQYEATNTWLSPNPATAYNQSGPPGPPQQPDGMQQMSAQSGLSQHQQAFNHPPLYSLPPWQYQQQSFWQHPNANFPHMPFYPLPQHYNGRDPNPELEPRPILPFQPHQSYCSMTYDLREYNMAFRSQMASTELPFSQQQMHSPPRLHLGFPSEIAPMQSQEDSLSVPSEGSCAKGTSSPTSCELAGGGVPLALPSDVDHLSEYLCLVRGQIDLFAAAEVDVNSNMQGRNRPIVLGQVGVRCRYCAGISPPKKRPSGAVYYPSKLSGLYQAAINMAKNHFSISCTNIPPDIKAKLDQLKEKKTYMLGGGKGYWSTGGRIRNVIEVDDRLFFEKTDPLLVESEDDK